jgi:hypothetical protein
MVGVGVKVGVGGGVLVDVGVDVGGGVSVGTCVAVGNGVSVGAAGTTGVAVGPGASVSVRISGVGVEVARGDRATAGTVTELTPSRSAWSPEAPPPFKRSTNATTRTIPTTATIPVTVAMASIGNLLFLAGAGGR